MLYLALLFFLVQRLQELVAIFLQVLEAQLVGDQLHRNVLHEDFGALWRFEEVLAGLQTLPPCTM